MIDPRTVRKLLRYDPLTGKLFWRERTPDMFEGGTYTPERRAARWNTRHADTEAFTAYNDKGYRHGALHWRIHSAHRVIWAIMHGEWPDGEIDHINGDRSDNRWINLRDVGVSENQRNAAKRRDNNSGTTGVCFVRGKWVANININGRRDYLGQFDNKEEAIAARKAAELKYDFHPNHGRVTDVVSIRKV